jgi:hypothetical protein
MWLLRGPTWLMRRREIDHRAARDADGPHVERVDVQLLAADLGRTDLAAAVLDHGDVGAGAADLEEQPSETRA